MKRNSIENDIICPNCGSESVLAKCPTTGNTRWGYFWLTWLFFFIPPLALIFLIIWTRSMFEDHKYVCPYCGNDNLIPLYSPMGKKIKRDVKN